MNTELNILKQISENKGKASIQSIAKGLKMRSDYIRYLCLELIKKGLMKKLKRRDWCKITRRGLKEIGKSTKKPKKHIFAKKRRQIRKKIKRKIKRAKKKKIRRRPKWKPKQKPKKRPKRKPEKKQKLKKKAVERKVGPRAKKIKKLRVFSEKEISKPEAVLSEKTPHLGESEASKKIDTFDKLSVNPEQSRRIEIPTVSRANKIIKVFKTLFGIKRG